ncbi:aromatic acid exporter family protein [Faecalispora jeddahensis]|uniref:aromatic acid exporter family protein n=1 Tax=Faecalispora jeddahensis TaxID=1414721 RepID=UPI0027B9DD9B|nr:aromatic acid exporter family protein [Faecalispora jeddahensis]
MKTLLKSAGIKAVKAAAGACAAVALALALGLQYPTAAGIITLLSLQETKRETLITAGRRIPIFLAATAIAFFSFQLLSYTVAALGVYLLAFVTLCHTFSAAADIAMCSVLVTHYWVERSMALGLIGNELLLLVIGAGIGILLNLFLPVGLHAIRKAQREIDSAICRVLDQIADAIQGHTVSHLPKFSELERLLEQARAQANRAADNALTLDLNYYREYIDMRTNQFLVLQRIQIGLLRLNGAPSQAEQIAVFLRRISSTFGESNNAAALLDDANKIRAEFRASELPRTREEFEDRAALLHIFNELEHFLLLKSTFAQSLTPEQRARYWNES